MKILVVDDHVLIREALRGVLKALKGEAAVVIEAPDAREALQQLAENPDVELASMAWNTLSSSPGEREMTPRTSLVAVSCSRASASCCSSSSTLRAWT